MSDFTMLNIMDDVPDSMAEHAPGEIEGRFTRGPIGHTATSGSAVSRTRRTSAARRGTTIVSRRRPTWSSRGSGRILLDDEPHALRQWDVVRVGPSVVRAFEAGPDGLDLVAVGGPKPEGGDGVLAESTWPAD